jgi:hypothetical protein
MMTASTPAATLLFREEDATPFSTDAATLKPWERARACLAAAPKVWLTTVRPDGRPHTAPVLLVWADGVPCLTSRPGSRKSLNLAGNAHCVITASDDGLDLVVEGEAARVRDDTGVRRVADAFQEKYDWEFTVRSGTVAADPRPGSPEYAFYRITPTRAFGYGADGLTATRWRFDAR